MKGKLSRLCRQKIISRIKRIFYASVDFNLPRVSALALALLTRKINNTGEKRILFLGSRASLDDIDALVKYSGKYQYLYIERFYFGYILRKYIQYSDLRENNYFIDEKYSPGRKRTYEYISVLFQYLQSILNIDALMTSNLSYIEQIELFQVAKDKQVPIIILLREGMVHPKKADIYFSVYDNKRAICDLFLCYNESIKSAILNNKVPGLNDDNMKVTGIPRCDFYIKDNTFKPGNQLVFFTYNADVKFNKILSDERLLEIARQRTLEFFQYIFSLAENRKDIEVIFKTKPSKLYIEEMKRIVSEYFGTNSMPDNLTITEAGAAKDLILQSRWVLGISNSTTLLEALLAKRRIGCPDFSDILKSADWDFFSEAGRVIHYIASYEDLIKFIDDRDDGLSNSMTESYYNILNHYLYNTDGMSSRRVEKYISSLWP